MKKLLTYSAMLLTGIFMSAQKKVEVQITGFENNTGNAMIALYNSENNFLEDLFKSEIIAIENNMAEAVFSEIPDGVYAISVFHDEDSNGKLNMVMGLYPSEATGTSNNAPARFGPPKWEDAKFELKNDEVLKMEINL
jgi:uncharacterized protein (DUF2141 family)